MLIHNGRLEYTGDFSPSNNTSVSYVTDPNTDYYITIENEVTHNRRLGYGFDFSTQTGWSVVLNYERYNAQGNDYNDNLYFMAGFVPNKKNQYVLNLKGTDANSMSTGLNIVKNIYGFSLNLNLDQNLFSETPNQNADFSISKKY